MTAKWYINEFAQEFGCWDPDKACQAYVIDLYRYAPAWDEDFRQKYILNNHMNPMGYIMAAKLIDSYIDYIIRHNMKDFEYIGFMGTNIPYK